MMANVIQIIVEVHGTVPRNLKKGLKEEETNGIIETI